MVIPVARSDQHAVDLAKEFMGIAGDIVHITTFDEALVGGCIVAVDAHDLHIGKIRIGVDEFGKGEGV